MHNCGYIKVLLELCFSVFFFFFFFFWLGRRLKMKATSCHADRMVILIY